MVAADLTEEAEEAADSTGVEGEEEAGKEPRLLKQLSAALGAQQYSRSEQ